MKKQLSPVERVIVPSGEQVCIAVSAQDKELFNSIRAQLGLTQPTFFAHLVRSFEEQSIGKEAA